MDWPLADEHQTGVSAANCNEIKSQYRWWCKFIPFRFIPLLKHIYIYLHTLSAITPIY